MSPADQRLPEPIVRNYRANVAETATANPHYGAPIPISQQKSQRRVSPDAGFARLSAERGRSRSIGLFLRLGDDDVGSAEFQRLVMHFLAASAEDRSGGNQGRNDNDFAHGPFLMAGKGAPIPRGGRAHSTLALNAARIRQPRLWGLDPRWRGSWAAAGPMAGSAAYGNGQPEGPSEPDPACCAETLPRFAQSRCGFLASVVGHPTRRGIRSPYLTTRGKSDEGIW